MKRIALAVCDPALPTSEEDQSVMHLLRQAGYFPEIIPLEMLASHPRLVDAVLLRSCEKYHLAPEAFRENLRALQNAGCQIWNPASAVLWNMDKTYLRDLEKQYIPIVPTYWVEKDGGTVSLQRILTQKGWNKAVVKPTISAGAWNTWVTAPAEAPAQQEMFEALRAHSTVMVQPYMESIHEGEWSLLFFHKRFSHAIRKRPKDGDFRVQPQYGSFIEAITPSPEMLAAAERVLAAVPEPLLYARVDGVMEAGKFLLMELEIIEPMLFLRTDEGAIARYVEAIKQAVSP